MQAAMDPEAFQGLDNYMQVLEAAAQARGMNSATAGRLASAEELKQAAATPGAKAADLGAKVVSNLGNPFKLFGLTTLGEAALNKVSDNLASKGLQKMTQSIFSPDGMDFLRQMEKVQPKTEKAITATSNFLGQQLADRQLAPGTAQPTR